MKKPEKAPSKPKTRKSGNVESAMNVNKRKLEALTDITNKPKKQKKKTEDDDDFMKDWNSPLELLLI